MKKVNGMVSLPVTVQAAKAVPETTQNAPIPVAVYRIETEFAPVGESVHSTEPVMVTVTDSAIRAIPVMVTGSKFESFPVTGITTAIDPVTVTGILARLPDE